MLLLAGSFDGLQVGVFIFVCFVLAGTIWLYYTSMKSLRKLQEEQRRQYSHLIASVDAEWNRPSRMRSWAKALANRFTRFTQHRPTKQGEPDIQTSLSSIDLLAVKQMLEQQQQFSQRLLAQIDHLHVPSAIEKQQVAKENRYRIEELELLVEQKEDELHQLHAQQRVTEKLASKLEQVQQQFDSLQDRLHSLESQAAKAACLAIELDDSKAMYAQLSKELAKKNEKVQHLVTENTQLQQQLADTEDKLQEANAQRHQLFKKIRLLEDTNNELEAIADTNKKLQNELHRIGELESRLNMIIEERNQLLRK
jgi:chromosome segregation ATPase